MTGFTCKPQNPTKHASSVAEMPSQAIWPVTDAPPATSWTTLMRDTAGCSGGPAAIHQLAYCSWPVTLASLMLLQARVQALTTASTLPGTAGSVCRQSM